MMTPHIRQKTAQIGFNSEAAAHSDSDLHSVRSARSYLRSLSETDWQHAAPPHANMSGEDYRSIWTLLAGERG